MTTTTVREYPPLEDEIDLRQYIRTLLRYWRWIVGLCLLAAALAFAISSILPPQYEATALVAVTGPLSKVEFESRIRDNIANVDLLGRAYTEIATSDEMVSLLLEEMHGWTSSSDVVSIEDLRNQLDARFVGEGKSGNVVRLTVRLNDPEKAAQLANIWAKHYIAHLNFLFGSKREIVELEKLAAQAKSALERNDQELARLRREYGIGVPHPEQPPSVAGAIGIVYELQIKTQRLAGYEGQERTIARLLEEAKSIAARAEGAPPALLSGLLADMLGLGLMSPERAGLVRIDLGNLDVQASALALVDALEAKQAAVQEAIDQLRSEVTSLQAEVAQRQMELEQLSRERSLNESVYLSLARKLEERRIEQLNGDVARVASRAVAPEEPSFPKRMLNTALAGVAAVIVTVFGVFFAEYWRQGVLQPDVVAGEATV